MSVDEDGVGTLLGGRSERHSGVDSELAGFIGGSGNNNALVALPHDHESFSLHRSIVDFFHGDEEGVHVDVEDGAGKSGLVGNSHAARILAAGLAYGIASFWGTS